MEADSVLVDEVAPSPNHDERRDAEAPSFILLHYTGMESGAAALARLRDPEAKVSSHYLVEEDGRIVQLVPERRRAWHAGEGIWQGRRDLNSRTVGIEIVNPGHQHGYRPFPAFQIHRVIELCRDCVERLAIPPRNILAHSDIAPDRKEDPGEFFPFDQLFRAGLGTFVPPAPVRPGRVLGVGDEGPDIRLIRHLLATIGYGIDEGETFDARLKSVLTAFQRRFRPSLVDGRADGSTVDTLRRLALAARAPS